MLPVSATVPPLSLSNKAMSDGQHQLSNLAFHCDILIIGIFHLPISILALQRPFEAKLPSLQQQTLFLPGELSHIF